MYDFKHHVMSSSRTCAHNPPDSATSCPASPRQLSKPIRPSPACGPGLPWREVWWRSNEVPRRLWSRSLTSTPTTLMGGAPSRRAASPQDIRPCSSSSTRSSRSSWCWRCLGGASSAEDGGGAGPEARGGGCWLLHGAPSPAGPAVESGPALLCCTTRRLSDAGLETEQRDPGKPTKLPDYSVVKPRMHLKNNAHTRARTRPSDVLRRPAALTPPSTQLQVSLADRCGRPAPAATPSASLSHSKAQPSRGAGGALERARLACGAFRRAARSVARRWSRCLRCASALPVARAASSSWWRLRWERRRRLRQACAAQQRRRPQAGPTCEAERACVQRAWGLTALGGPPGPAR